MFECVCVHARVSLCFCMHACVLRTCTCVRVRLHGCSCVHRHACGAHTVGMLARIRASVCVRARVRILVCILAHIHTSAHAQFSIEFHLLKVSSSRVGMSMARSMIQELVYRCVRISIRGIVCRSVGRLVGNAFVKIDEKWTFTDSR